MTIADGTLNERDNEDVPTLTSVPVFLGRETMRRAQKIATAKGLHVGGYVAQVVRNTVNFDFETLKQREREWGALGSQPPMSETTTH